jgi:hypothetical protein
MKGKLSATVRLAAVLCGVAWLAIGQLANDRGRVPPSQSGGSSKFIKERGPESRAGVPEWSVAGRFRTDVFTFVRLRYHSSRWGGGLVDYPGADLNLSYRLQQLTSMRVDPEGLVLDIDDPQLFKYPFVFMIDPRSIILSKEEAALLRRYLLNGGFLMVDDFWGDQMWNHLMHELKKVFPERQWVSLPLSHPIFNIPYPVNEKPQVPSEDSAHATRDLTGPYRTWEFEITWERPQPADYRAFLDDKGRIMLLICWNTDLSDGWEEEGISEWFFTNFSEKYSYPMGINIIYYALTH